MDWTREKKCAVIGLARAGAPAAKFLAQRGNRVVGYDVQPLSALSPEARALHGLGVELKVGDASFPGLSSCHLIVLSPGLKIHHEPLRSMLLEAEMRGAEVIGELELAARHCIAPMIAVTGTKGKSTTVKLIAELVAACGVDVRRAGNTGTPLIAELPNLSPQGWAVVEVSSFQLEKAPTFKPRVGVLLNLLPDHQDYHPSLDQYWSTKLRLFAHQKAGDTSVWNLDDPQVLAAYAQGQALDEARILAVSGRGLPQFQGQALDGAGVRDGQIGWVVEGRFEPLMAVEEVPLRGDHNRANVAAALACVLAALGAEQVLGGREELARAVREFESLPHRLEVVAHKNGLTWVNDSQATIPDAALAALRAFDAPVTLIVGGRNKLDEPDAFDALLKEAASRAHALVTIGESGTALAQQALQAGMDASQVTEAKLLSRAVKVAMQVTPPKGTVVLSPACASFDQFKSFEDRGEQFRQLVRAL
jgi:UDP-N-acetylmuramoylalanine--D-glutamate ligase